MSAAVATAPVVVGVDGSASGILAARWGAEEAKRLGVPLSLVHAVPRLPRDPYPTAALYVTDLRRAATEDGARFLSDARQAATEAATDVDVAEVQHIGGPTEVLSRESAAARMVVIGAIGRIGLADLMIGSTALALPARSHAPVVIVRDRRDGSPADSGPVVVAVAGTPLDEAPLEFAFDEASKRGAELIAVHAWSDAALPEFDRVAGGKDAWRQIVDREKRVLAEALAGYTERYPDVPVESVVVYDRPARALVDYSATAQLLVVGTRGRGPLTGTMLGSTSRAVGKLAECPVAIVRLGA